MGIGGFEDANSSRMGLVCVCSLLEAGLLERYSCRGGIEVEDRDVKCRCDDGPIRLSMCEYLASAELCMNDSL